LILITKVN